MYQYAKGSLQPRRQNGMNPAMSGQQVNPVQLQAMREQQLQAQGAQQTQAAQAPAFPQANGGAGVNASPHQIFIQEALKQGYSPDMVMKFLANQLKQR
jgi:hypothetical protein